MAAGSRPTHTHPPSLSSLPPSRHEPADRGPQSRAVHLAELEVLGLERLLDVALPVPRLLLLRGGRRRGGGGDRRQPVQHLPDVKFPHGSRRRRCPLRWPRRSRRRRPPRRRQTSPRREGGGAGAAALLLSRPWGGRRAQTLVRQRGAAPHRGTEAGVKQIRARQPTAPPARDHPPASPHMVAATAAAVTRPCVCACVCARCPCGACAASLPPQSRSPPLGSGTLRLLGAACAASQSPAGCRRRPPPRPPPPPFSSSSSPLTHPALAPLA